MSQAFKNSYSRNIGQNTYTPPNRLFGDLLPVFDTGTHDANWVGLVRNVYISSDRLMRGWVRDGDGTPGNDVAYAFGARDQLVANAFYLEA